MAENSGNIDLNVCWQAFIQGDEQAFAEIHKMLFAMLYNYALKMQFGDEALSDDCVQELFIKLWTRREKLPEVKSVKAYMMTSLRRHILNNIRNRHLAELKIRLSKQPDIEFSHDEIVMKKEEDTKLHQKILELLNTLPKRQKEVIYLHYFAGMDHNQIAAVMGINYQSVSNLKQKAIEKMRDAGLLQLFLIISALYRSTHF
ncbi:MAG TPA: sigma-70 family RNA polymerase sigma factor [Panacibacter sp.]|nr:sigma-70 family RNA polymerase sigma factor [Panacibacter sp.]